MSPEDYLESWPHAPTHQLSEAGTYFVTAGTYPRQHHFRKAHQLNYLQASLLRMTRMAGWTLEAWAVFSHHYHFIAHSPQQLFDAVSLARLIGDVHSMTGKWLNETDGVPGRKVWHNYWDTRLSFPISYRARLNYVHQNAVKHGLVVVANHYKWCSARWFERMASPAQIRSVYSMKTQNVKVNDDFEEMVFDD